MVNLIKAEIYKLKTTRILFIIAAILILLSFLMSFWYKTYTGKRMILLVFEIQLMFPLIIIMGILGATYLTSEFKSGGFKRYIYYGHKRSDILLSKSLVYMMVILLVSSIMPVLTVIINSTINGFNEYFDSSSVLFIIRITLLNLLVYSGIAAVAIFISLLFKSTIAAIGVFYGVYNLYVIMQAISMKNDIFKAIYDKTIFGQIQIASSENVSTSQIFYLILITLITIFILLSVSVYLFKKREIK